MRGTKAKKIRRTMKTAAPIVREAFMEICRGKLSQLNRYGELQHARINPDRQFKKATKFA